MKKYNFEMVGKLKDGTTIMVSDFVVGSEVSVIDEQGVKAPLLDGEHELESGDKFVTVDSKITEIIPAEAETEVEATTTEEKKEEVATTSLEEVQTPNFLTIEAFEAFKSEISKEIIEAMIDSKINGLTPEKKEEVKMTEVKPKSYRDMILEKIQDFQD